MRASAKSCLAGVLGCGAALVVAFPSVAHHALLAKFDDEQSVSLSGVVTAVDWRNPHVHVLMIVEEEGELTQEWWIELPSVTDLRRSGWTRTALKPGDRIEVEGMAARDGSPQAWGSSVVNAGTGEEVFTVSVRGAYRPFAGIEPRPTPRWPNGQPRLGMPPGGTDGYWAYPSSTMLIEDGVEVETVEHSPGLLRNLEDAPSVAPFRPWAEGLFIRRQSRYLQDDPVYLHCKPTAGPRQFQQPEGIQFIEDPGRDRIFVLLGSGNRNYRIVYLDGREPRGQLEGTDDNPIYYGWSVGEWDGDTLVVESTGFNEDFWFSNGGLPHTRNLRMVERFSRPDYDTLAYEVTIEDPAAYTRPWTSSWTLSWISGEDMPPYFCQDNRP